MGNSMHDTNDLVGAMMMSAGITGFFILLAFM